MLSEGEPMVMDFGIAKAVTRPSPGRSRRPAPRSARPRTWAGAGVGRGHFDARAASTSLGAVLRMIAGTAVHRPDVQAIISKLFTETAPRCGRRQDVPDWLDATVSKRSPSRRMRVPTAAQFAQALTWPSGTSTPADIKTTAPPVKSIAVLPFVNMSTDAENDNSATASPKTSSTR